MDGFEQKDSQGFENSYNSYEQYPLENFFIFTIYQNYTLALMWYCYSKQMFILYLKETSRRFFRFSYLKVHKLITMGMKFKNL